MNEDRDSWRIELLYSLDALVAGLLFTLAIMFAFFAQPSDLVGVLTDLEVHFSWDNRASGSSVAALMLAIAVWRSWRIYQSKAITISMQLAFGLVGFALIIFKMFLFLKGLRIAMIGGIMSM